MEGGAPSGGSALAPAFSYARALVRRHAPPK